MVDWSKAPAWANYAAMDEDGRVWWYQFMPFQHAVKWTPITGMSRLASYGDGYSPDWRTTLTTRPDAQPPAR